MKETQVPPPVEERLSMRSDAYIEILFHWQRYLAAASVCRGKRVLDLASGDGYGSNCLAQVADRVVGVDIDARAVAEAQAKYVRDNLRFVRGSADRIPLADASVDVVVSFETLEHLAEEAQGRFFAEIDRVLAPDGLLLISSPDRRRTESSGMRNPFHLHELTLEEMQAALRDRFAAVEIYRQEINLGAFLWRDADAQGGALHGFRIDHAGAEAVPTDGQLRLHLYLIAVCARNAVALPSLSSVCSEVSRRGLESLWNQVGALGWQRDQAVAETEQLRRALDVKGIVGRRTERAAATVEQLRTELARAQAKIDELAARPWWVVGVSQNPAWRAARSVLDKTPAARLLGPVKDRVYHFFVRPR